MRIEKRDDILYMYEFMYAYVNTYGKPHRERRNSRKCNSPSPILGTAGPLGPLDYVGCVTNFFNASFNQSRAGIPLVQRRHFDDSRRLYINFEL